MRSIRVAATEVNHDVAVLLALDGKSTFVHHVASQFHTLLFIVGLLEDIVVIFAVKVLLLREGNSLS